jgi:hypothetical protein
MSTLYFPSDQIQIYRQRRISGTDRYSVSATYTAYKADIQPASPERTQMFSGRFGQVFTAFVEVNVDIKEGDQVQTANKRYSVKGVQKWQGAGLLDHIELVLVAQDGN